MSIPVRTSRLAAALAASLLGACASLVPPPPAGVLQDPAPLPARFAADRASAATPAAVADWSVLGDATLASLVRRGLQANLSLQQAIARIDRARALAVGRDAARGLTGGVQAGASASRAASVDAPSGGRRSDRVFAHLAAGWELDLFDRLANDAQAGWLRVQAQSDDAQAVRLSVTSEIASTWYALQGLREQERLTREVITNRREVLRLVTLRTRAGETARLDEARAQAELADVLAQLPRVVSEVQVITHRLAVLLGETPSDFVPPAASVETPPRAVALRIPSPDTWLRQRADLRAVRARLHARNHDIQAIEAEFMPRMEIRGVLGFVAGTLGGWAGAGSAAWWLAPTVSAPIFDRRDIAARLSATRAQEREDVLAYRDATLRAIAEVEDALGRLGAGQQRLDHLRDRLRHANDAHRLAQLRFGAGEVDLLVLLDTQRVAHVAALALAEAHSEQQQRAVELLKALGAAPQAAT
ncbi:MAG: efflux transporter outer membrane subunit [Rhodoferax sp.]|nr:efflux transporter outer membrane subunit [Rhodoferax sp.]